MTRQVILDTETTGLDPVQGHRMIEFAGLEMVDRKLTGQRLHLYIHPGRDIDAEAERVHGISLDFLADKPRFAVIAPQIERFLHNAELIIHNAPFDIAFLNAEFQRVAIPSIANLCSGVIDTLVLARDQFPGKRNNLDVLCDRFDISRANRTLHGALVDCELLAQVYLSMTRGQELLTMNIDLNDSIAQATPSIAFERKPLRILYASAEEQEQHQAFLDELAHVGNKGCVWYQRDILLREQEEGE